MELIDFLFNYFITFENIFMIILGSFIGLLLGAVPGLGSMIILVLLLPITYTLSPLAGILLMVSAYMASEYSGSIASISIGIPGTPSNAATLLDGRPYAQKHSSGKALSYSLVAGTIGGILGILVLIFLSSPLAAFALRISFPEYFLIGVLGILAVAVLSSNDMVKSLISVALGLMAGTVGIDLLTGAPRFTMSRPELYDGIGMAALIVGVFAFSEIFSMINEDLNKKYDKDKKTLKTGLSFKEIKKVLKPIGFGSLIGSATGVFPGLGSGSASWFGYSIAKKTSKTPETFGKGNPEGIVGPEAANNAAVGGALLPLLTLGIPGSPAIAIIMGALIIHGITPGPEVFSSDTNLVYGIFSGALLGVIVMYIFGRLLTPAFARLITIPNAILVPMIIIFSLIGAYISNSMFFEVWFTLIIGVIAFFFKKLEYSLPAFILAFVLCGIIEENFRRSLVLSGGDYSIFVTRPFSLIILIIIILIIATAMVNIFKKKKTV